MTEWISSMKSLETNLSDHYAERSKAGSEWQLQLTLDGL